jgi:hypothetical protein
VELTYKLILELTFVRTGIEIGTMHENSFRLKFNFLNGQIEVFQRVSKEAKLCMQNQDHMV